MNAESYWMDQDQFEAMLMAEAENNEGDGSINVEGDDVVDADFEVVE